MTHASRLAAQLRIAAKEAEEADEEELSDRLEKRADEVEEEGDD